MLRWYSTVVDAGDHRAQAAWWAQVLGWQVFLETDDEAVVIPTWAQEVLPHTPFERVPPGLVFVPVPEPRAGKNRLHLDLAPPAEADHAAEIQRLVDLGARRVDVGQGDAPHAVLADPEGNEFCVLTPRAY
jgi:catechol 2,3-dioxygenase-like lactoylglutathione lyase family enzyme